MRGFDRTCLRGATEMEGERESILEHKKNTCRVRHSGLIGGVLCFHSNNRGCGDREGGCLVLRSEHTEYIREGGLWGLAGVRRLWLGWTPIQREGTCLGRLLGLYGHNTFINSETYGQQDQTNNTPSSPEIKQGERRAHTPSFLAMCS